MTDYLKPLDKNDLEAIGITGWAYGYADKVRFHELDALNHVNNAVYLRWFETIRVAYLQDYGFTSYSHTENDPQLVVRAQSIDYLAPMLHNETYILTTKTRLIKPSSFIMDYAVISEGQARATGTTVMVSLTQNGSARRPHKTDAIKSVVAQDGAATEGI